MTRILDALLAMVRALEAHSLLPKAEYIAISKCRGNTCPCVCPCVLLTVYALVHALMYAPLFVSLCMPLGMLLASISSCRSLRALNIYSVMSRCLFVSFAVDLLAPGGSRYRYTLFNEDEFSLDSIHPKLTMVGVLGGLSVQDTETDSPVDSMAKVAQMLGASLSENHKTHALITVGSGGIEAAHGEDALASAVINGFARGFDYQLARGIR